MKKILSVFLIAIFCWVFLIAAPYLETRSVIAYAADTLPATDLSAPEGALKFSWARIAGREDAVFLNIPSNQLNNKIMLPQDPAPLILAKYDESTSTGTLAIMRMRQVGPNIQAGIYRITPKNFQHYFGIHLWHFAFLSWKGGAGCDWNEKYLRDDDPPKVDIETLRRKFTEYDAQRTMLDPIYNLKIGLGLEKPKVNRSNLYWHQRLNDDPCWERIALKDFDKDNDLFNDISYYGFLKLIALAQHIHKAPVAVMAIPKIRQAVETSTKKSAFKKTVATTVSYHLSPQWTVSTPKRFNTQYSDFEINTTNERNGTYSFVKVQGEHTFPVDETLIYQWSESKSGWTGLFVFLAVTVGVALLGGVGGLAFLQSNQILTAVLVGAGVGAIGGLVATGFSPTTNTTAEITPFSYSAYQLDPSQNMSGDAKEVATRTFQNWISPEIMNTPGGVQVFVTKIDIRRAALCGGASHATDECTANPSSSIVTVAGDDPKFKTIFNEMMYKPQKDLQKYKYPYERNADSIPVPVPPAQ